MFGSSLSPVVCRRGHVLYTLFVFVCVYWCPQIVCSIFVRIVCLCCHFLWMVHLWLPLWYSLTFIADILSGSKSLWYFLLFVYTCIYISVIFKYQNGVTLTGLITAHFCVCPKTGSRFLFANAIIWFVFHDVRLEGICNFFLLLVELLAIIDLIINSFHDVLVIMVKAS